MAWIAPIMIAAQQEEEEQEAIQALTEAHGAGWEFKVLRSLNGFASDEGLEDALLAESAAGWTLARQLDGSRLILMRPESAREYDALLGEQYNPYREHTGNYSMPVLVMLIALVVGAFAFVLIMARSAVVIPVALVAVGIVVFLVIFIMKGRSGGGPGRKSKDGS